MGSEDEAEQSLGRPSRQATAGPSGHANSPHPSSREGHLSTAGWSSSVLLSLILHGCHAAAATCSRVQRNSVPSIQMRCMITANRQASANRNVQSSKMLHAALLLLMLEARSHGVSLKRSTQILQLSTSCWPITPSLVRKRPFKALVRMVARCPSGHSDALLGDTPSSRKVIGSILRCRPFAAERLGVPIVAQLATDDSNWYSTAALPY